MRDFSEELVNRKRGLEKKTQNAALGDEKIENKKV